jgi:hypothetical protein
MIFFARQFLSVGDVAKKYCLFQYLSEGYFCIKKAFYGTYIVGYLFSFAELWILPV